MTSLVGKWTEPGSPRPSSHLVSKVGPRTVGVFRRLTATVVQFRCGLAWHDPDAVLAPHDEPPATGKTCETCLRLSRRDG